MILSLLLILTSTILSISASSWFMLWFGLELNLLSFIWFLLNPLFHTPLEATLKYFIIQALGSVSILFLILSSSIYSLNLTFYPIIFMGIIIKMGMFPTHSWYLNVGALISWSPFIIFITWQKIAPLFFSTTMSLSLIFIISLSSSLLAVSLIFTTSSMRKIILLSSILNISWILPPLILSPFLASIMFITYSMISLILIVNFKSKNTSSILKNTFLMPFSALLFFFCFMNLAGLPPSLGFLIKIIFMSEILSNLMFFILTLMLLLSVFMTFIYIRPTSLSLMFPNFTIFTLKYKNHYKILPMVLMLTFFPFLFFLK